MIAILAISVFVILLTTWFLQYFKYEKHLKIFKGPRAWPLIGSALEFGTTMDLLPITLENKKKYGSIFKVYLGFAPPTLIITDPKFLEFVMGSTRILDKSEDYRFLHSWLGRGLLTSGGAKWQKHRKILTPAFHFRILEQFVEVFDFYSNTLVQKLEKEVGKKSVDIYPYVTLCSLDTICATSMGTEVNAQNDSESKYVFSVKEMSRIIIDRTFSIFKMFDFFYYFSKDYQKEREALKILHGYTESIIESRKEELIKANGHSKDIQNDEDDIGRKKKKTFLDLLLQYKKDGQPLTDKDIREEVDTFMFEGHDTTAAAMSFALYCLAKNPEAQEKTVQELRSIFGDDKERPATHRDMQEMKYLEAVIKETLRLYPSVPIFARNVHEDVEYDGIILPKDTSLTIFVYGLHRDPAIFPDPERFDPERFTQEKQVGRSPYAYLPFSAGPRNCIGQKFAMLEMKSLLSKVLRNYELLEDPNHKVVLAAETVLKSANGIRIGLKKRNF
ncbi:hypothetical protein ILUMI_05709 [Ignelater luminosus]|uniref:Cytochrome P450 n=1 Tax=Ignelater luminosus TaxID=2038154 RepID=A0A8K0D772_IGNLU|nr:hypothetical protein ILUMI_05709 [Ignelater luminosus]